MENITQKWMSYIDGNKKLSELTIPGTHDTGTWGLKGAYKCQNMKLKPQLDAGIRFLDIRLKAIEAENDELYIFHGGLLGNTGLKFTNDILKECKIFLQQNPSETIIMSIKNESQSYPRPEAFYKKLKEVIDSWFIDDVKKNKLFIIDNSIPTLQTSRGKIVLLRRFPLANNPEIGLNIWNKFPDDDEGPFTNDGVSYYVQDRYKSWGSERSDKFDDWVKPCLMLASGNNTPDTLYLNYSSATGFLGGAIGGSTPRDLAEAVNPLLVSYLNDHPNGRYGIIPMDFPEYPYNSLISSLISSNFNTLKKLKPFHRFLANEGNHFYTANYTEAVACINKSKDFTSEGIVSYVYDAETYNNIEPDLKSRLTPLYRWYNQKNKQHFYTNDLNGETAGSIGYIRQRLECYMYKDLADNLMPLYRLNKLTGEIQRHFCTTSNEEKESALKNGWTYDKVLGIFTSNNVIQFIVPVLI